MSDIVVKPVNDADKRSKQTPEPYQSIWFAHWMRTSCDAARGNCSSDASRNKELDDATRNGCSSKELKDSSRSDRGLGMIKIGTFEFGDDIIKVSSKSIGNETLLCSPFKDGQNTDDMQTLRPEFAHNLQKCSGVFPGQSNATEESETTKSCNDCFSLLKLQNCVHDVETIRICTTMDALEGKPEDHPTFSQTTNVNLFKDNGDFRSTRVSTKISGNTSREFYRLSPFSGQDKKQLILQPLNRLIDSEVKENRRAMDIDFLKVNSTKNLHSGSKSTASTKAFNMWSNLLHWSSVVSSREGGREQPKNKRLDISLKLPTLLGAASSSQNTRPSSSKTRSLEMDKLLEQPKSDFPNADPGNRWIKRLKLSSSNSDHMTTSLHFASNDKPSKLFNGIPKSSSAPALRKQNGENSVLLNKSGGLSKKDKDHFTGSPKYQGKALLLSHAWMQRWMHNAPNLTQKQSSKITLGKLHKEQFPSIAAMALMGKALACFRTCELQKRGPFTVWNTKTFG